MTRDYFLAGAFCLAVVAGCALHGPSKNPVAVEPTIQQVREIAAARQKSPRKTQRKTVPQQRVKKGPIDDCLMHSYLYSRVNNLAAECTNNYVHFYPKEEFNPSVDVPRNFVPDPTRVRIGSYNLFHLGDGVAAMKSYELIAKVMNRWDIVGAQELMPLPTEWQDSNDLLFSLITAEGGTNVQFPATWDVMKPGYMNVLLELQKLDPSWALILQPKPIGEGSTGEMAGFYYRSRFVGLKEWDYCDPSSDIDIRTKEKGRSLGCLIRASPHEDELVSRKPFAAYFQVGNFDFVGVTAHVRFSRDMNLSHVREQSGYICKDSVDTKKCRIALDDTGRFYEIKVMADHIDDFKIAAHDDDVIYMADTNLEIVPNSVSLWQATLKAAKDFTVFQTDKTTLSVPNDTLVSNYDHFIFNPNKTSECDPAYIKSYNYWSAADLKAPNRAQSDDSVIAAINTYLRNDGQKKMLDAAIAHHSLLVKAKTGRQGQGVRPLLPKELAELSRSCTSAIKRMQANKTGALMELLSDHLPIEMSCRIDRKDDD